jgi:putative ABC transport system permease protein
MGIDLLQEIAQTLRTHKTRTALAVLTVAWGVFMLVLLLGAGRGIQNGVELQFKDDAVNSIRIYQGKTTIAHEGLPRGSRIRFDNRDYDIVRLQGTDVDRISARYYPGRDLNASYNGQSASYDIRAVHPDHTYLEKTRITRGRFINQFDLDNRRKVCVIGRRVKEALFGDAQALGEYMLIGEIPHRVVGIFSDDGGQREEETIYLPVTTAQLVYGAAQKINQLLYTVGDASYEQSKQSEEDTRTLLAERHGFSADDKRAVRIYNNLDEYQKITDLFYWIRVFVAVVGAGTVLTGILAVSNIMVISVAERRREIGIRKALGATPASITRLIVTESLILTSVAGYIGLLLSIGLLEVLKRTIAENDYMYQPDVNNMVVISVTLLVIVAGTLAGYLPARKAALINPVEALQTK